MTNKDIPEDDPPLRFFRNYPTLENIDVPVEVFKKPIQDRIHYKSYLHALMHDDTPFISTGYRKMPINSLWRSFLSIFTIHNDTMNFWTHFIPGVYFLLLIKSVVDEPRVESDRGYFIMYLVCASITMIASAIYHVWRAHNEKAYHFCLTCDLQGILLLVACTNGLIQGLGLKYFPFWRIFWLTLTAVLYASLFYYVPYFVKRRLTKRRTFFFASYALMGLIAWYQHRLLLAYHSDEVKSFPVLKEFEDHLHVNWSILEALGVCYGTIGLGLLIRGLKVPERFKPKTFDIVGSSHQIFHCIVALGAYLNFVNIYELKLRGAFPDI